MEPQQRDGEQKVERPSVGRPGRILEADTNNDDDIVNL